MQQKATRRKPVRCAIYTRKSVMAEGDSQDFTSLEAQRLACENYVRARSPDGWTVVETHYDDPGYSGGNMDRPAFQRLLADAEKGEFDVIVCYKIDRLSRRLVDFCEIFRKLEIFKVRFVSVTQEFNTDTSMGRMCMNLLMVFGEFEREMTRDRVRDKVAAARRKGFWTGGSVPYGYRLQNRKLVPDPATAPNVKHIFELYRDCGSPRRVCKMLSEEGIFRFPERSGKLNTVNLSTCLRNVVYIGRISLGDESYPGIHEALVDAELWDAVQARLKEVSITPRESRQPVAEALLQGLLRCGTCGGAMVYRWTRKNNTGARYGYYVDVADLRRGESTCPVRNVPAGMIEALVEDEVMKVLRTDYMTDVLAHRLSKSFLDVRASLADPSAFWSSMSYGEKCALVRELVSTVAVYPQAVEIRFRTSGREKLKEEIKNANA